MRICRHVENHVQVAKVASAISLRIVNASVGDRLQGFARWVVIQLKRILKDCNHWLPNGDRIADAVETFDGEQRHFMSDVLQLGAG